MAGLFAPPMFADGRVMPLFPELALATGQYNHVPVLAGNTKEEAKLFGLVNAFRQGDYDRFTTQFRFDSNAAPTLAVGDVLNAAYLPVDKPFLGWNAVSGDVTNAIFTSATTKVLDTLSRQQPGQTWYDRFDWKQEPAPYDTVYGASHAMDLSFVFGNFGLNSFSFGDGDANAPGRLALSGAMMDTIGAFAANGHPDRRGRRRQLAQLGGDGGVRRVETQANVHVAR